MNRIATVELAATVKDPDPGKIYSCAGPGIVSEVCNYTAHSVTFFENADGTGEKQTVKKGERLELLEWQVKSWSVSKRGKGPEDEPAVTVFRILDLEDTSKKEAALDIEGDWQLVRVDNESDDRWIVAWGNPDGTGDKALIEPEDDHYSDGQPCRRVSVLKKRPAWASEDEEGEGAEQHAKAPEQALPGDPEVTLEWGYSIPKPKPGTVYSALGPGTVTFVNNFSDYTCTFWDNSDGTGANCAIKAKSAGYSFSLNTKSVTVDGARSLVRAEDPHIHYQRELGIRGLEDGKVYVIEGGGELTRVANDSKKFWITVWENADCTGRKLVIGPDDVVAPNDDAEEPEPSPFPFPTGRALSVHSGKPKGA
ncbi:hypothetical protein [Streptomyces sp. SudanB182_2057]|uniref:hypothetical protein n=1 Tax=Streptomyces sp. SudanB182_2057 TaxID=3035281 RepID=UPI003F56F813